MPFIEEVQIKKFRGFDNVSMSFGTHLTVIAGQNGTQKTTLLGIISQPFTISDDRSPMKDEKPLSGGSYKSAFSEKFRLSEVFDTAKSHEWTLKTPLLDQPFVLESIKRGGDSSGIRFWRKGSRERGSGYIQLPVIFLSLKRLLPIGEDSALNKGSQVQLDSDELDFYKKWHNKILSIHEEIHEASFLSSPSKDTIGINTATYDWSQNSAGQDNIGKILLAVLSFRRLQKKFKDNYKGGILVIDEVDASLYPASQIDLIKAFRGFASKFKIQIILTTHSLSILKKVCEFQEDPIIQGQNKVVYLEKLNNKVKIIEGINYSTIKHKLNITLDIDAQTKIFAFSEDKEAIYFAKALLKSKKSKLKFVDCTFSCSNLVELNAKKVPSFCMPNSMIFLDGDVRDEPKMMAKINRAKNIIVMPSKLSPERLLAQFLSKLDDESIVWKKINPNYNKQFCFKDFDLEEIMTYRVKAKDWFKSQYKYWGINAVKVINPWMKENQDEVDLFVSQFTLVYNNFARKLGLDELS